MYNLYKKSFYKAPFAYGNKHLYYFTEVKNERKRDKKKKGLFPYCFLMDILHNIWLKYSEAVPVNMNLIHV
jgi:hypothetical protein